MSLTKRWIEEQMDWGYDVLHPSEVFDERRHIIEEEYNPANDIPNKEIDDDYTESK